MPPSRRTSLWRLGTPLELFGCGVPSGPNLANQGGVAFGHRCQHRTAVFPGTDGNPWHQTNLLRHAFVCTAPRQHVTPPSALIWACCRPRPFRCRRPSGGVCRGVCKGKADQGWAGGGWSTRSLSVVNRLRGRRVVEHYLNAQQHLMYMLKLT